MIRLPCVLCIVQQTAHGAPGRFTFHPQRRDQGFALSALPRFVRGYPLAKSPLACLPFPAMFPRMSTVQEIEQAISRLSPEEMRLVRDWLENQLEDQLQMTDKFKGRIESSERQMAEGQRPRTRRSDPA